MQQGRKPIPTALKLINGNPGGRALNANEPQPKKKIPHCPKILVGDARREYFTITKKLARLGLMSEIDTAAMVIYCQAWADWCEANRHLMAEGKILLAKKTRVPQINPWWSIKRHTEAMMDKMLAGFGMIPSSRSRIDTKAAELDDDDGLLG